jgi:hypothetical protein
MFDSEKFTNHTLETIDLTAPKTDIKKQFLALLASPGISGREDEREVFLSRNSGETVP